jgi:hypothetical protein
VPHRDAHARPAAVRGRAHAGLHHRGFQRHGQRTGDLAQADDRAGDTRTREYWALNGGGSLLLQPSAVNGQNSPFAGRGGPFHAAHLDTPEFGPGILAVGAAIPNTSVEFHAFAPPLSFAPGTYASSFEDAIIGETMAIEVAPPPPP